MQPDQSDLKKKVQASRESILNNLRGNFSGEETQRWVSNMGQSAPQAAETIVPGALSDDAPMTVGGFIDWLFDYLGRYAFELSNAATGKTYSCERPSGFKDVVKYGVRYPSTMGHVTAGPYTLVIYALGAQVSAYFLPSDYLVGFDPQDERYAFEPYVTFDGPDDNHAGYWAIDNNALPKSQMPRLARRLITQLTRISNGECDPQEKFSFSASISEQHDESDSSPVVKNENGQSQSIAVSSSFELLEGETRAVMLKRLMREAEGSNFSDKSKESLPIEPPSPAAFSPPSPAPTFPVPPAAFGKFNETSSQEKGKDVSPDLQAFMSSATLEKNTAESTYQENVKLGNRSESSGSWELEGVNLEERYNLDYSSINAPALPPPLPPFEMSSAAGSAEGTASRNTGAGGGLLARLASPTEPPANDSAGAETNSASSPIPRPPLHTESARPAGYNAPPPPPVPTKGAGGLAPPPPPVARSSSSSQSATQKPDSADLPFPQPGSFNPVPDDQVGERPPQLRSVVSRSQTSEENETSTGLQPPAPPAQNTGQGLSGLVARVKPEIPDSNTADSMKTDQAGISLPAAQSSFLIPGPDPGAIAVEHDELIESPLSSSSEPTPQSRVEELKLECLSGMRAMISSLDKELEKLQASGVAAMQNGNFELVQNIMEQGKRLKTMKERLAQLGAQLEQD